MRDEYLRVIRMKGTAEDLKLYERDRTVYGQGQSFGGHPFLGHLERRASKRMREQTVREVEGEPGNAMSCKPRKGFPRRHLISTCLPLSINGEMKGYLHATLVLWTLNSYN